jgi:hypothetical protein
VAIMGGTGLVRWFPELFARFLPSQVLVAAQLAHGEEATLAALALFVWHLYNVHLRPGVFPMNWVWLHGKMSVEELREEHAAEHDRLFPPAPAPATPPPPAAPAAAPGNEGGPEKK